jgi:hypothetical protein
MSWGLSGLYLLSSLPMPAFFFLLGKIVNVLKNTLLGEQVQQKKARDQF